MLYPPLPASESARLQALDSYHIVETPNEEWYDDIIRKVLDLTGVPIAFISLLDEKREWFKSKYGLEITEVPREHSFSGFAILNPGEVMEVTDARYDERFVDNPLTTAEPHIVYYAGAPIADSEGNALGVLAVADKRPRELSPQKLVMLQALAELVGTQLELRKTQIQLDACQTSS